jgi:predicted lipoprotein with Yx(FWY)xxD motif
MRSTSVKIAIAGALAALALAACSSSDKSGSAADTTPATEATTTTAASSGTTGSGGAAVVKLTDSKYGKILVDSNGMTLYVDENDKPDAPACTGACLQAWPPLAAKKTTISVGPGLTASKYTVVTASDGTKQVAVNGSPLYTWMGDKKPGDVTGQGVNGFYVVQANGEKYEEEGS